MKKAIALGLSSVLILTAFAGCKAPEDSGSGTSGGAKKTTLKVAALESAYGADMWKQIKEAFEKENEGVTIELTIDKNLEDVISPSMKSGFISSVESLESASKCTSAPSAGAAIINRIFAKEPSNAS